MLASPAIIRRLAFTAPWPAPPRRADDWLLRGPGCGGREGQGDLVVGPQLATGGVDAGAPVLPHGGVDAEAAEVVAEGPDPGGRCAGGGVAGGGVQRDQVHVGAEGTGPLGQLPGVDGTVVDPADQRPLEGQAPPRRLQVVRAGGHEHVERVAPVQRDELVAEPVVGRVQGHGQVDRQRLAGQPPDAGDDADGRDGQVPGGQAQVVVQPDDGLPDPVVVGHRLAHAHEDDVGQPPGPGRLDRPHHLLDHLAAVEVALEAGLPGGAEAAGHGAARPGSRCTRSSGRRSA